MIGPCTTRPKSTAMRRRAEAMLDGMHRPSIVDRNAEIRRRYLAGVPQRELALDYDLKATTVSGIVRKRCANAG